jgi:hypothetical protein
MTFGLERVFLLAAWAAKADLARSSSTLLLWLLTVKPALLSWSKIFLLGISSALASS